MLDFIVEFIIIFLLMRNRDVLDRDEGPLRFGIRVGVAMLAVSLAIALAAFLAIKITGISPVHH